MKDIWYLGNKINSSIMIFENKSENFDVVKEGELTPIISNGIFILINKELFDLFSRHFNDVKLGKEVSICDRQTNMTIAHYYKLKIKDEISPALISTVDDKGIKLWHFGRQYIFISGELKKLIELANIENLITSLGFGGFG